MPPGDVIIGVAEPDPGGSDDCDAEPFLIRTPVRKQYKFRGFACPER